MMHVITEAFKVYVVLVATLITVTSRKEVFSYSVASVYIQAKR